MALPGAGPSVKLPRFEKRPENSEFPDAADLETDRIKPARAGSAKLSTTSVKRATSAMNAKSAHGKKSTSGSYKS